MRRPLALSHSADTVLVASKCYRDTRRRRNDRRCYETVLSLHPTKLSCQVGRRYQSNYPVPFIFTVYYSKVHVTNRTITAHSGTAKTRWLARASQNRCRRALPSAATTNSQNYFTPETAVNLQQSSENVPPHLKHVTTLPCDVSGTFRLTVANGPAVLRQHV